MRAPQGCGGGDVDGMQWSRGLIGRAVCGRVRGPGEARSGAGSRGLEELAGGARSGNPRAAVDDAGECLTGGGGWPGRMFRSEGMF